MSDELMGIARAGLILARPGEPRAKLLGALEIIEEVAGADWVGLIPIPGTDVASVPSTGIWTTEVPGSWHDAIASLGPIWEDIRAHKSVQLGLRSSPLATDCEALLESGVIHVAFLPLLVEGFDSAAVAVFRKIEIPWSRDPLLYLRVSAVAIGNFLSNLAVQERLEVRKRAFQQLVDEVDGAVVRVDAEGSIRLWNRGLERWASEDIDLLDRSFIGLFVEAQHPMLEDHLEQMRSGAKDGFRMFANLQGTEHALEVEVVARVVDRVDGRGEFVASIFDARHQKRSVDVLARELKRESLGVMAGGIAHDFNNLLQSMLTSVDILAERFPQDDEDYEFVELIRTSGRRMGELTSQLRAFARGGNPIPKRLAIVDILEKVLDAPRFQGESRVRVKTTVARALPPVSADPAQLFQVFYNIAVNAFEAIEASRGNLSIVARSVRMDRTHRMVDEQGASEGEYIEVTFADSGKGISEDDIQRIFDPFFTTKSLGSGLGLAAAHGIIRAHHGYLDVQSRLGMGTTVRVYLPVSA